ncbi:hypothetical protein ACQP3C_29830, partial [Escherichia coli]
MTFQWQPPAQMLTQGRGYACIFPQSSTTRYGPLPEMHGQPPSDTNESRNLSFHSPPQMCDVCLPYILGYACFATT